MRTLKTEKSKISDTPDGIKEVMRSIKDLLINKLNIPGDNRSAHDVLVMEKYGTLLLKKMEDTIDSMEQTKKELQQSEGMLKQAEAMAHLGCWELDFATNKSVWSEECCRIYGLLPTDTIHTFESWFSFIHPEDLDIVNKEIKRSHDSLSDSFFYHRIVCKDGTIKHLHSSSKFKFNSENKPVGLYGIAWDITEQKIVEANLLRSEKLFRALIENSADMKTLGGPDGNVFYASPAFTKVLGYTPEEIYNIHAFDIIHPEDAPGLMENLQEILQAPGKSFYRQQRLLHKNGSWIWCEGIITNMLDKPGVNALVSNFRDITKRKETEDKLNASNKELETFIYKASHDLRTPLSSIIGLTTISKFEIKDEKALEYLEMIESSTVKLDKILISLVESITIKDTNEFNAEIIFTDLITKALDKFSNYSGFSRMKISTNVSFTSSFVSNEFIIGSIFQNLIENAVKYQDQNSTEPFLNISVSGDTNGLKIEFEDNGIGIESSAQEKVFDMYFKATDMSAGSGLGLYLVKTGVEKLGGTIELSSVQGKGTHFKILITDNLF